MGFKGALAFAVVTTLASSLAMPAVASEPVAVGVPGLENSQRGAIVEQVCVDLERSYVYAEDARRMADLLRTNLRRGEYIGLVSLTGFSERLTSDLRSIRPDLHLEVSPIEEAEAQNEEVVDHHDPEYLRRRNFQIRKVEVLDGNVGYLALDGFPNDDGAGAAGVAAMNFLARADALIIDLRENGGGGAAMIQLLMSYLHAGREQLSSIYIRESDTNLQFWTNRWVEGSRLTDVPVWVLVSENTFSAAEAFAYDIKHMGRGTIVGEVTMGGAHPVNTVDYPELGITVRVPFARAVSPITGSNWEGVGVQPDVPVPAERALTVAHAEAVRAILQKEQNPQWRAWLEAILENIPSR